MISGLYSASTSMDAITRQQDAIAGNIANAGVSGHKGETVVFRSFPDLLFSKASAFVPEETQANKTVGRVGTGVGVDWAYLNFQPGPMVETGVPTDLSIDGDGFFVVQTPGGERLTRNSQFRIHMNPDGQTGTVTTGEGFPLLGEKGPIEIPAGEKMHVDQTGNVVAGEQTLDRIRKVTVPDKNILLHESNSLFQVEPKDAEQITPADEAQVRQGYLEKSNVNTIVEMVRMIESFRNYESSAKVMTTLDRSLELAINEVGQVI